MLNLLTTKYYAVPVTLLSILLITEINSDKTIIDGYGLGQQDKSSVVNTTRKLHLHGLWLQSYILFLWFCLYQPHNQAQNMDEHQIRERREPLENPTGHTRVSCSFLLLIRKVSFWMNIVIAQLPLWYIIFVFPCLNKSPVILFLLPKEDTIFFNDVYSLGFLYSVTCYFLFKALAVHTDII